jgi:hypothetical protein
VAKVRYEWTLGGVAVTFIIVVAFVGGLEHLKRIDRRERFAKCMTIKHDEIECDVYARAPERR